MLQKGWDLQPNQLLTCSPTSACRKHLPSLNIYNHDSALELSDKIICSINWIGFKHFSPFFKRNCTQFFPLLFIQRISRGSCQKWFQPFSLMCIRPLKIGQKMPGEKFLFLEKQGCWWHLTVALADWASSCSGCAVKAGFRAILGFFPQKHMSF